MDTYFDILPTDINTLIFSKLNYDDVLTVEDLYDLRYSTMLLLRHVELYGKIVNIIKLNEKLKFKNFKRYLPISWKTIYLDILILDESTWDVKDLIWSYTVDGKLNPITVDIFNLMNIQRVYPNLYKYMDAYLEYPYGVEYILEILDDRHFAYFTSVNDKPINGFIKTGIMSRDLVFTDPREHEGKWETQKIILNLMYIAIKYGFGYSIKVSSMFIQDFISTLYGLERPEDTRRETYGEYMKNKGIYDSIISYVSTNTNKLTLI